MVDREVASEVYIVSSPLVNVWVKTRLMDNKVWCTKRVVAKILAYSACVRGFESHVVQHFVRFTNWSGCNLWRLVLKSPPDKDYFCVTCEKWFNLSCTLSVIFLIETIRKKIRFFLSISRASICYSFGDNLVQSDITDRILATIIVNLDTSCNPFK